MSIKKFSNNLEKIVDVLSNKVVKTVLGGALVFAASIATYGNLSAESVEVPNNIPTISSQDIQSFDETTLLCLDITSNNSYTKEVKNANGYTQKAISSCITNKIK